MLINVVKTWSLTSCLIICFLDTSSTEKFGWLDHFVDYIKNQNNDYQALLLLNQNQKNGTTQLGTIVEKMLRNVPTLKMDMEATTNKPLPKSPGTTLIIIIYLAKVSHYLLQMSSTIDFLSKQFKPKRLPRCLLVLPNEEHFDYLKLLKLMWSDGFLDTTIVEVAKEVKPKNQFLNL